MANITITIQRLTNTAVYDSYTIDNGQTVNQLKTAIALARGYEVSWFNLVLTNTVLTGSDTLAASGMITGDVLRAANIISRLATREDRQVAKLDLASIDRAESSDPSTYDITQLPAQYSGDTIVDNPNSGGLVVGRPWA